jgi:Uma2 family endonuclease
VALKKHLPPSCHVFSSDVKVRVAASDLSTYPNVSVVCGSVERDALDAHAITNPTLLVEVTSPSTRDYDRGEKLSHYKQLPSLRAVILVAHDSKRITVVTRTATGWSTTESRSGETANIETPSFQLNVDEVYRALEGL